MCNDSLNQILHISKTESKLEFPKTRLQISFTNIRGEYWREDHSQGTIRIFLRWNLICEIGGEDTVGRSREKRKRGTEKSTGVQKHEDSRVPISTKARATRRKNVSRPTILGKKSHCIFPLSRHTGAHNRFRFTLIARML